MFKELYIIHGDAGDTHEFDDLEPTLMMSEFPDVSFYDGKVKTAVFIDDFEFSSMNKEQTARCNKLFRYVSSHKHVSVFCSHQLCFSLPSLIRRLANVWIIWKPRSKAELRLIANRVAMEPTELEYIFDNICTGHRDSLCIDFNKDTPAHLRKNLFEKIDPGDIKKGMLMEKMEKLQKKNSIEKSDPINEERLKISRNKMKYADADAGYVSSENDSD
jgi:hypothetical protein